MSAPGFTPISLYHSTTAAATPSAGNLAAGELAVNITDGKLFYKDNGGVVRVLATAAGSAGDVVGPGSSTDNALVRFDGTTGKLVQSSVGVLSDAGALSGLTSVAATTFTGALTGNASTATTLQTSRTIWGQSFDGSANVTGALTGVTDLTASGSLTLNGGVANGVAYLNGSKVLTTGTALTFDGTSLGVGTASPSKRLDSTTSNNSATDTQLALRNSFPGNNVSAGISFGFNTIAADPDFLAAVYGIVTDRSARNGVLTFNTASSGTLSEQMRLTSTGLGIGTSSVPSYAGYKTLAINGTSGGEIDFLDGGTTRGQIYSASTSLTVTTLGAIPLLLGTNGATKATLDSIGNFNLLAGNIYTQSTSGIFFTGTVGNFSNGIYGVGTNNVAISAGGSERARFTSGGEFAIGKTQASESASTGSGFGFAAPSTDPFLSIVNNNASGANANIYLNKRTTGTIVAILTNNGSTNSTVGSISHNGSSTSYNTTSDYRLKRLVGEVTGAGDRIDALNPVVFDWLSTGNRDRGFLAHEFQAVYANSVTGEKDGVDKNGKPEYQAMQAGSSEVIADLVAEIQSLRKRLAAAGIA